MYPSVNVAVVYVHPPPPIPEVFCVLFVVVQPELRPMPALLCDLRPSVQVLWVLHIPHDEDFLCSA